MAPTLSLNGLNLGGLIYIEVAVSFAEMLGLGLPKLFLLSKIFSHLGCSFSVFGSGEIFLPRVESRK